jgi:nitric oxide reductase NorQ protein
MSSRSQSQTPDNKKQIVSHFVDKLIQQTGGPVSITQVIYSIPEVTNISTDQASNLIDQGKQSGTYDVKRKGDSDIQKITSATPIGPEPTIIQNEFHQGSVPNDLTTINEIPPDIEKILNEATITTFRDVAEQNPEQLSNTINKGFLEQGNSDDEFDFSSLVGITKSENEGLHEIGYTTKRDFLNSKTEEIVLNTRDTKGGTLTEAKVERAKSKIKDQVTVYDEETATKIIAQARMACPSGNDLAHECLSHHQERKLAAGDSKAIVSKVEEQTETVGEPLAAVRDNVSIEDEEAIYISDIGHNEDDPVKTGFTILEDIGYSQVPKKESDPNAGHAALPVDKNGDVVPPTVPLERDMKLPLDELIAKKLARNVPVRVMGPRGSGKNYLMKYICYKTNRGYRSLDVDRATTPQDLFGPISPTREGVLEPKNASVKQGLINGDTIVINEFPVMTAGAAMSLHQLLNENKLIIKSHGQEIEPHPEARIVITMNPPTREYRDSEPMNGATRGRFRSFWQGYPDTKAGEVETLDAQVNNPNPVIDTDTLDNIVEFARRTREDENVHWPTLSTRNLTVVCEHIQDGVSPQAALKNVVRMQAEPNQNPEDAHEAIDPIF